MWSYISPTETRPCELGDRAADDAILWEPVGLAPGPLPASGGVDPRALRRAMGHFATGVAIITTSYEREPCGMTANSVTSVSLEPALILVCIARGAHTGAAVLRTGRLVVNILRQDQEELSARFAGCSRKKFDGVPVDIGEDGVPQLAGCLAYLTCRVRSIVPAGDHDVVFAEVEDVQANGGDPLLFYLGGYRRLPLAPAPSVRGRPATGRETAATPGLASAMPAASLDATHD